MIKSYIYLEVPVLALVLVLLVGLTISCPASSNMHVALSRKKFESNLSCWLYEVASSSNAASNTINN